VFEGSYSTYKTSNLNKNISAFQRSSKLGREGTACIIHGLPSSTSSDNAMVRELRGLASSVFVTRLSVDYYARFWDGWQGFVDDMDKWVLVDHCFDDGVIFGVRCQKEGALRGYQERSEIPRFRTWL
jgi:hypothetical protein